MGHKHHIDLERAAQIIREGGLVAMPTETVYGLAADATNDQAVARIFEAKSRPQFNPLIIHVTGSSMAERYANFSPLAKRFADAFWPGPLTLVLPRREDSPVSLLVSAGLDTIALRMPNHPIAQTLINSVDHALAAPSANRSGTISPTSPEHVHQSLGERIDMILDGGPCTIGVESTIVKIDADTATILRPGGLAREEIEKTLDISLSISSSSSSSANPRIEAPGMMSSHYAPVAPLRLNVENPEATEAYLAFGSVPETSAHILNLSPQRNLREAAANLFAHLRKLDRLCSEHNLSGIAVAPIPSTELGEAINDRLSRAAAPRD